MPAPRAEIKAEPPVARSIVMPAQPVPVTPPPGAVALPPKADPPAPRVIEAPIAPPVTAVALPPSTPVVAKPVEKPAVKPPEKAVAKPVTKPPEKPAEKKITGWRVQLGAFSKKSLAELSWKEFAAKQSKLIGDRKPIYAVDGNVTRLQVGPYKTKAAAREACDTFAKSGRACFATDD